MPFINDMLAAGNEKPSSNLANRQILSRFTFTINEVMAKLRSKIYGQDHALQAIENMLHVVRADLTEPNKPLYVGLFLGPSGVGKTEIVKVLAESIYGDSSNYCRVDMNTLSQDHYAAAITGAPPGYVGSKEGSSVLDKTKIEGSYSKPGILLLDEIEKAGPQVIQTLLNIFDNGRLIVTSGNEVIDFTNTIIIMTSNLGASDIHTFVNHKFSFLSLRLLHYLNPTQWGKADSILMDTLIQRNLERTFKPEFVNRIDDIIPFQWLSESILHQMIDKLLLELNHRLNKHQCEVTLESTAISFLIEKGYDKRYGGREMKRAFRKFVGVSVATKLVETTEIGNRTVFVFSRVNGEDVLSLKMEEEGVLKA